MKAPRTHPCHHPLWSNHRCLNSFKKVLRCFKEKQNSDRVFPEYLLWGYWYDLLLKCMK